MSRAREKLLEAALAIQEALAALAEDELSKPTAAVAESQELLLTVAEAARAAGLSRTAMFRLAREGAIDTVDIEGVGRRIRRQDVEEYVTRLQSKSSGESADSRSGSAAGRRRLKAV